jgi:hypothetical protein
MASDVILAGCDILAGSNQYLPTSYPYHVHNIKDHYIMIGCNLSSTLAIEGVDYIINNNCYFFKDDPTKYCYSYEDGGTVNHYTIAFKGSKTATIHTLAPDSSLTVDNLYNDAYANSVTRGFNGLDNSFLFAKYGIKCTGNLNSQVVELWQEKGYTFAILKNGTFIAAPSGGVITLKKGDNPSFNNIPNIFVVDIKGKEYLVNIGMNSISSYPDILSVYPALSVYGESLFLGSELLNILKNQGCIFTELKYINNYEQHALNVHVAPAGITLVNAGKLDDAFTNAMSCAQTKLSIVEDSMYVDIDVKLRFI